MKSSSLRLIGNSLSRSLSRWGIPLDRSRASPRSNTCASSKYLKGGKEFEDVSRFLNEASRLAAEGDERCIK